MDQVTSDAACLDSFRSQDCVDRSWATWPLNWTLSNNILLAPFQNQCLRFGHSSMSRTTSDSNGLPLTITGFISISKYSVRAGLVDDVLRYLCMAARLTDTSPGTMIRFSPPLSENSISPSHTVLTTQPSGQWRGGWYCIWSVSDRVSVAGDGLRWT